MAAPKSPLLADPFAADAAWKRSAEHAVKDLARQGMSFTVGDLIAIVGPPPSGSILATFIRGAAVRRLISKAPVIPQPVWIANASHSTPRPGTESENVWRMMQTRAVTEKIPIELVIRALRLYLGTP